MTVRAEKEKKKKIEHTSYSKEELTRFFEPRSVVLVGAAERTLYTQCTVQNAEIFKGATLHLVNRRGVPVLGRSSAKSCVELQEDIDTAFIHVPAAGVMDAIEDAHAAGIRNIVLLSSGFAEAGLEGRELQQSVAARARELGLMLLGPNHVGFLNLANNISVFGLPAPGARPGPLAVLSQSGAVAMEIARFGERHDIRMSHLMTLGNEAVITAADALDYVVDCPHTKAILIFIEEIKNPLRFAQAARRAATAGKAIIVYKSGVTEIAAKSAAAHTGALVGDDKVTDAVFQDLGIIRVHSLEDLVVTGKIAAGLGTRQVSGVGVISASGGANDIIADVAESFGVPLSEFAEDTKRQIVDIVPDNFITPQNPFDLTGSSVRDRTLWKSVMGIIGQDPKVDLVVCVGALITTPTPQEKDLIVAQALNSLQCPYVYVTTLFTEISEHSATVMKNCGFNLVSTGVVPTLRALGKYIDWNKRLGRLSGMPTTPPIALPDIVTQVKGLWSEVQARDLFMSVGVPFLPATLVQDADHAVRVALGYGTPVALKIVSSKIAHKSDIGGVALSVIGEDHVRASFEKVLAAGSAAVGRTEVEGVLISPMRSQGTEFIVGVTWDEQWGAMLVLGLGGIFVEVLADSVIVPLPTSKTAVLNALSKLKGAAILKGLRGKKAVDQEKLVDVVLKIASVALAMGERIESLEINPLSVDGSDIVALDALIIEKT
ncbi:MAG: acetate--CoA ligase family protein [Alcaligenaceae bacterium]